MTLRRRRTPRRVAFPQVAQGSSAFALVEELSAPSELLNAVRLVKLRADYLEFAIYQPIDPNGIDWARLYFSNRLNVGNSGAGRLVRATIAKLYSSTASTLITSNLITGTLNQSPTVTKIHSDATARVGTWTAAATTGPVSGVRYTTIIGDYVEYTVTGVDRIHLRGYQNNANGGTFDVNIKTGGVEIADANYCTVSKQVSARADSGWNYAPLAKNLTPASTYVVRLTLATNTPASSRGYDAGLLGFVLDSTALGALGTATEQSLGSPAVNSSRLMSPGTIVRYSMPDCTKVQLNYFKIASAGNLTATVRTTAGVEVDSITVDAYGATTTNTTVTVAEGLTKDDYILEVVSGNTKNASATDYRQYIIGGIAVDTTSPGDPATGIFDDMGAVATQASTEPITLQGSGNVEYAVLARRPADANGVNEDFITGTHGHESAPTGLVVQVSGTTIDYAGAAAGTVWNGTKVEWVYSTNALFVTSEPFATIEYDSRVDRGGYWNNITRTMTADAMIEHEYVLMVQTPSTVSASEGGYAGGAEHASVSPGTDTYVANQHNDSATAGTNPNTNLVVIYNDDMLVVGQVLNLPQIRNSFTGIDTSATAVSQMQDRADGISKFYIRSYPMLAAGSLVPAGHTITARRAMRIGLRS